MREIKFRVWDKIDKLMYYNVGLSMLGYQVYKDRLYPEKVLIDKGLDCGKVMQYTGLKDKNGKEIYEGDLIRSYHIKAEVVDFLGSFGIFNHNDFLSLAEIWDRGDGHKVEVIGNIYENPELKRGVDV